MRILVTGSNGLLGQKLLEVGRKDPELTLIGSGRGENRLSTFDGQYYELDITDLERLRQVVEESKPDTIINTAAMTNVDLCELNPRDSNRINVDSVDNLARVAMESDLFLIHLSTDFIFNGEKTLLDESEEPDPVNYYGRCKLASEEIVMEYSFPWAIVRTVLVYGITENMSRSNIVLWVYNSLNDKKEIQVVDDQLRTPTLAEDLADGCLAVAKLKKQGVFHISGEDLLSPYQIAIEVADHFKLDKSLISRADSTTFTQPARRPPKTGFNISKAKKELGYQPHSFRESLSVIERQLHRAL